MTNAVGEALRNGLVLGDGGVEEEARTRGLIDEMVAPDGVYDAAAAWASRFVDAPRTALAAAKAGLDDVYRIAPAERWDAERRRYLEVFDANLRRSTAQPT